MNDRNSNIAKSLEVKLKIPEKYCKNKEADLLDLECNPGTEYDKKMADKSIAIL